MNFYKHHIGDYAQATAHLSFVEDAAYSRLLRKYYAEELPLPADLRAVQRLIGARTRDERNAVKTVLDEFFDLQEDGWHNKRADEELGKAAAQADTNRQIAADRETRRRERKQNESLAGSLNGSSNDSLPSREPSQTPDSRHQTPRLQEPERAPDPPSSSEAPKARASSAGNGEHGPTPAGEACKAMRAVGLAATNPGDPRLIALLEQGATVAEFSGLAAEAAAKGKGFAWVLAVLQARRADAASIALAPPPAAPAWHETRDGVQTRAYQLGFGPYEEVDHSTGRGISWHVYRRRVIEADAASKEHAA